MKCPLKPKIEKFTSKQYGYVPIEHINKDFDQCDEKRCMAYCDGKCKLIEAEAIHDTN